MATNRDTSAAPVAALQASMAPGSTPSPHPVERQWQAMVREYAAAIRPERRLAAISVVLYGIAGGAEGAALGILVPLFASVGAPTTGGGVFTSLFEFLGFHGRGLAWASVAGFALLGVVASGAKFAASSTTAIVQTRVEAHLRKDLTTRLLGMEWSAFQMMRFDDIANSIMMESYQVGLGIQQLLIAAGSLSSMSALVLMALVVSAKLTLVVIGFAMLSLLVLKPMGRRAERYTQGWTVAASSVARQVAEVLGNLKFFRSTGHRKSAQQLFTNEYDEYARWWARIQIVPLSTRLIYEGVGLVFLTVLLAASLATSTLSVTTLIFLAIFFRLSPRVGDFQTGLVSVRAQFPWLIRWKERRAAAAAAPARAGGHASPTFSTGLAVEQVSFAFSNAAPPVLKDVSWELRVGESIAFVGESGAGKTTMLDLVTGLLTPTHGRVAVDGVSLSEVDLELWQARIGLVLQGSSLFHATVRENVVGGRGVDDDLIWQCLTAAHAEGFVRTLPDGLDTVIGERGGRLSGGERQRLSLARALYRRPWLLVLDEPTSQLDSVSEHAILEALKGVRGQLSMLIVAHRLATIEMADRICVIERGRIVQAGSWEELMSDPFGSFARMAAKQGLLARAVS